MCRMAALSFEKGCKPHVANVLKALYEAAAYDNYLEPIAGDKRHCHGHGYVLALLVNVSWRIIYERFDAAPFIADIEKGA